MNQSRQERSFLFRDSIANLFRIFSLLCIALGLFAVIAGAGAIYLNLTAQLELERADRAATEQADRIGEHLADIQRTLQSPSLVEAAQIDSGNGSALRAALQARGIFNVIDARVLPASIEAMATGAENGLNMVLTELAIEAIRDGRAQVRVIEAGTPEESLAFVQRLPGDRGIVLVRLTVNVATQLLEADQALDFVALAQTHADETTLLATGGQSAAGAIRRVPIANTRLELQWIRAVIQPPFDDRSAVVIGCVGVIVLMLGLLLRRRTRLAHYLAGPQAAAATGDGAPRAQPARASSSRSHRTDTVVLDPKGRGRNTDHDPQPREEDPDDPPTVVAQPPDLPAWLVDDDSSSGNGRWS